MEFGIPSKKVVNQEKYPNVGVITMQEIEGNNSNRRFEFNKKSFELLGFVEGEYNEIAFSFDNSNIATIAVVNVNDFDSKNNIKIGKNKTFSNKKYYEEVKNRFNLAPKDKCELILVPSEQTFNDHNVFYIKPLEEKDLIEKVEDSIEESEGLMNISVGEDEDDNLDLMNEENSL